MGVENAERYQDTNTAGWLSLSLSVRLVDIYAKAFHYNDWVVCFLCSSWVADTAYCKSLCVLSRQSELLAYFCIVNWMKKYSDDIFGRLQWMNWFSTLLALPASIQHVRMDRLGVTSFSFVCRHFWNFDPSRNIIHWHKTCFPFN